MDFYGEIIFKDGWMCYEGSMKPSYYDNPIFPVRIYKKAVKVVAGGVDAYMNLVMATAYEIADPEGKRKNAIQLQPYHLEKAQKLIKKFTSK